MGHTLLSGQPGGGLGRRIEQYRSAEFRWTGIEAAHNPCDGQGEFGFTSFDNQHHSGRKPEFLGSPPFDRKSAPGWQFTTLQFNSIQALYRIVGLGDERRIALECLVLHSPLNWQRDF